MGGGIGLGSGGTSTATAQNISKINNTEKSITTFLPTNTDKIGKVSFNIEDKNETPYNPEQNQIIGETSVRGGIISKSNNYIILIIAILTLLFLLLKHKII